MNNQVSALDGNEKSSKRDLLTLYNFKKLKQPISRLAVFGNFHSQTLRTFLLKTIRKKIEINKNISYDELTNQNLSQIEIITKIFNAFFDSPVVDRIPILSNVLNSLLILDLNYVMPNIKYGDHIALDDKFNMVNNYENRKSFLREKFKEHFISCLDYLAGNCFYKACELLFVSLFLMFYNINSSMECSKMSVFKAFSEIFANTLNNSGFENTKIPKIFSSEQFIAGCNNVRLCIENHESHNPINSLTISNEKLNDIQVYFESMNKIMRKNPKQKLKKLKNLMGLAESASFSAESTISSTDIRTEISEMLYAGTSYNEEESQQKTLKKIWMSKMENSTIEETTSDETFMNKIEFYSIKEVPMEFIPVPNENTSISSESPSSIVYQETKAKKIQGKRDTKAKKNIDIRDMGIKRKRKNAINKKCHNTFYFHYR